MPTDDAYNILIIGAAGDLALNKLYPALYYLHRDGNCPEEMSIYGISRRTLRKNTFLNTIKSNIAADKFFDDNAWQSFARRLIYTSLDATDPPTMKKFSRELKKTRRSLIIYLAMPPNLFTATCQSLKSADIVNEHTRIVVEKPLGDSQHSFIETNNLLSDIFHEQQIYRIDHYLGKEAVQNLLVLRFANLLYEPLWNHNYIDHVQITVAETVGVDGRAQFYDATGALRDMVQNHLLQLLCLIAMDPPATLSSNAVSDEKLKILRSLKTIDHTNARDYTVRAQYTGGAVDGKSVVGYMEEKNMPAQSTTETFVALRAEIDSWRWSGVPFYLRTGKRLPKRSSEIVIQYKQVPHIIFPHSAASPNTLIIRLQPNEGIQLKVMNKVPGLDQDIELSPMTLDLFFSKIFAQNRHIDAYELLLLNVIRGDTTLFMRADEVEAAWEWVDKIRAGWHKIKHPIGQYTAGTWGPTDAVALLAKRDRSWYEQ